MTKEQINDMAESMVAMWRHPELKKLLRAQLAAAVSPGFEPNHLDSRMDAVAALSLELADEIIKQAGL